LEDTSICSLNEPNNALKTLTTLRNESMYYTLQQSLQNPVITTFICFQNANINSLEKYETNLKLELQIII